MPHHDADCGLDQRPAVRYRNPDQWQVLIKDAHPGYISWAQYEVNCQRLANNCQLNGVTVTREGPAVLEVALQVQQELQTRLDEADRIRYQHVEQARYEMDAARQRYLAIDPHNHLVAGELEAHWNDTIGAYRAAQATYE